jgi:dephospho-CoA kinase/inosine/xanthosine triphosphate pyrophosphatase family protein
MRDSRPRLREIFFRVERRLDVHFYTSNIEKFLQARSVFEKVGLILRHFRTKTEPYHEEYSLGKHELLARALDEVRSRVGAGSIFFVEDTSIRIETLSTPAGDVPGLAAKEWFASTTFESLDVALKARANDRRATVKSDIGVHIPSLQRPIFFHGETTGAVASTAPTFSASVSHPWLTPTTFNGWIIPDGARKRLGEMSFEESWPYDFRVQALLLLIERLEEYTATLNLPTSAYSRRAAAATASQLSLLDSRREVLIIVGRTCAGKTTMGERLSFQHGFRVFEASAVLRTFQSKTASDGPQSEQQFAKNILADYGSDAVARKLLDLIDGTDIDRLAVTGFRTIEELECMRGHFPEAKVVFVDASERTRYERRLKRARADEALSFEDFNELDRSQWSFGLLRVAEELADVRVMNEGSLDDYYSRISAITTDNLNSQVTGISTMLHPRHAAESNQLVRSLEALEQEARPLDCGEIEAVTTRSGFPVRHNNANKVLKTAPELAARIEMPGSRVRYKISDAGRAYLRLVLAKERATRDAPGASAKEERKL